MTPWVYEFRWETGHIAFLLLFLSVAVTVVAALVAALVRSARDHSRNQQTRIMWKAVFEDLPQEARSCRHQLTGELRRRICPHEFNCRLCDVHADLLKTARRNNAESLGPVSGLEISDDRLYHRGHTWVRTESDGLVSVGLDDLGKKLAGTIDELRLPPVGERVEENGVCWTMKRGGAVARILSPVDGTVTETGNTEKGWFLKVRLSDAGKDLRHLLTGREARFWMLKELERLQLSLSGSGSGGSLADGGTLVQDIPAALKGDCSMVWEEMFLQP